MYSITKMFTTLSPGGCGFNLWPRKMPAACVNMHAHTYILHTIQQLKLKENPPHPPNLVEHFS